MEEHGGAVGRSVYCDPRMSVLDRTTIAERYLSGNGIEIGALHFPLPVPAHASVRYVDRHDVPGLRDHYPELASYTIIPVDIVDDGETLTTIPDASQDFVIANHFLEHCEDPIRALLNFFRVLKPGGILYMAIPDKRFTFDIDRPITTLSHLIEDHERGPEHSREQHYREWVRIIDKASGQAGEDALYKERTEKRFSIHFHVWTKKEMEELLEYMRSIAAFDIECSVENGNECIFVLRKRAIMHAHSPS